MIGRSRHHSSSTLHKSSMETTLGQHPLILITRGVWCVLSFTSTGMGGFKGRKDSLLGVAPELVIMALIISEIKGEKKCSEVLCELATGNSYYFRKTFKKVLKFS
jgi:hypothetical protein